MSVAPRVSILIPVYNRAHCIEQTLASALDQSFDDLEVVVVDNCSTDATWELIQRVAARDARVRAFRNDRNIGPVRNWLRCVREARGELGKILWSDDLLHQEYLAEAIPPMADEAVGFVYSPAVIFFGENPLRGAVAYQSPPSGRRPVAEFIEGTLLKHDYPASPGCALFRLKDMRDCLLERVPNRVGSDFAKHAIGSDVLLFLLVAERYPFFFRLAEPLSYFRIHQGSISVSAARGKLPLHYDIAKAWFVSRAELPPGLVARFNAMLCIDLMIFPSNPFGLRRLADFYPEAGRYRVAACYMLARLAKRTVSSLRNVLATST
jgi:glycosyltransferase involved in cell wall biosynthesis